MVLIYSINISLGSRRGDSTLLLYIPRNPFTLGLEFTQQYLDPSNGEFDIIMNPRRSVHIHNSGLKAMGLLDLLCLATLLVYSPNIILVPTMILTLIIQGLYGDDGLMLLENSTKINAEQIKKLIHNKFKSLNFKFNINNF